MKGFRWLCQRYLHCFPIRPGRCLATKLQFFGPWLKTNFSTSSSSSLVFISEGLPKALWPRKGSKLSANDVGTERQSGLAEMRRFFSNSLHRTTKQVVWVFHLPEESTNVSERCSSVEDEENWKIIFVDMLGLRFYWQMSVTPRPYPKCLQSWWKRYYFLIVPCCY
jgi:hypothetical protein